MPCRTDGVLLSRTCCALPDFRDILKDLEHPFELRQHSPRMAVKTHRLPRENDGKQNHTKPKSTTKGAHRTAYVCVGEDSQPKRTEPVPKSSEKPVRTHERGYADRQHIGSNFAAVKRVKKNWPGRQTSGCESADRKTALCVVQREIQAQVQAFHASGWRIQSNGRKKSRG